MNANRERFPTTGTGATAKVTLRLTRGELLALDRYSARKENYPQPGRAAGLEGWLLDACRRSHRQRRAFDWG
jgi:hypothetical protein